MPELLDFRLDELRLGLNLDRVERVERAAWADPLPGAPDVVVGVVNARGRVLPVVDLRPIFGRRSRPIEPSDVFVIADTGRRPVALLADAAEGVRKFAATDVASAESVVPGIGPIEGVLRLPDGMILIANLGELLSLDDERALSRALDGA